MFTHRHIQESIDSKSAIFFKFSDQIVELTASESWNLFEGWRVEFLYSGLSPILILQLVHRAGDRAVWYLGADGVRRGGNVDELDDDVKRILGQKVFAVLKSSFQASLEDPQFVIEPIAHGFLELDQAAKADLTRLAVDRLLASPGVQLINEAPHAIPITVGGSHQQALLKRQYIVSALIQNLQENLVAAVKAGRATFSIPSPINGQVVPVQASLCFGDFHFAYRFVEPHSGIVFYLIAGYELSQCYGVYFPQCHTIFCLPDQLSLARLAAHHLPGWLADHFVTFGKEFADYAARPISKMTSMLRAPPWTHIGHQLWNELTGIDKLLQNTALNDTVEWIVPDGNASIEFYGAIDDLFPPLRGNVRRGYVNTLDEIRYIYENNRLAIRITRDFVSADLRTRILDFAALSAPVMARQAQETFGCNHPLILLGLRVENRTLVDLTTFYMLLITAIQSAFPAARFLIDGHNASRSGGHKYRSHGERAEEANAVIEAEREIERRLVAQFGESTVASAIGLTVPENLLLINQCDFFVSMWGAGLAKYRWVCNRPGFVITSSWNLTHRSDLRIYDHPSHLQNSTPIYWVDPALVTDHPDAPRMVTAGHHPQWSNFALQKETVIRNILEALNQHVRSCDP